MKKFTFLLSIVGFLAINSAIFAQTTINSEDFETLTLGTWAQFSVTGSQSWYAASYGTDKYAKISGYSSSINNANEDWLISPKIDFTAYTEETFSFRSAAKFTGPELEVFVSTNYTGTGSPATATWTKLTATLSADLYTWTSSGNVDLSSYTGNGYVAFKYTSTTTGAKTYEIDDILITGKSSGPVVDNGEDTITVMQYNLLAYTSTSYISCNQTNNSITSKNGYIKTIVKYVKPDIFTVNEISKSTTDHETLRTSALNVDGVTTYKKATSISNVANQSLINEIYYKSDKFTWVSQDAITGGTRDVNVYKLKYNKNDDAGLPIYLTCIVAHLKAGSTVSDSSERISETARIMTYLGNQTSVGNVLLMGDFNIGTSTEQCYQNLINPTNATLKLNDPANKPGNWWYSSFSAVHTQSTHTDNNGCAESGGLDDRFDFILASNDIMAGTQKVTYMASSYKAVGQDGSHYNLAINASPANNSVPAEVLNALYNNSDHLPIMLKLKLKTKIVSGIEDIKNSNGLSFIFANPTSDNLEINIENSNNYIGSVNVEVYSIVGQQIVSKNIEMNSGSNEHSISLNNTKPGIYFVRLTDKNQNSQTKKLIIK